MDATPSADHSLSLQASDLSLPVDTFALGWQAALTRAPRIETSAVDIAGQPIKVIALKIPRTLPRVYSFTFPECPSFFQTPPAKEPKQPAQEAVTEESAEATETAEDGTTGKPDAKKLTRIKPPGDIVKLEDRLYYVLQPPLESLVKNGSLTFPFEPFPYQFQGIAFMYPRYTAVLADEMGLGKTMQAITTIRMLVRAGEIRNCLLVCPNGSFHSLETPPTALANGDFSRELQWVVDGGTCNECGNCDTHCPQEGGPYRVKPRWIPERLAFEAPGATPSQLAALMAAWGAAKR